MELVLPSPPAPPYMAAHAADLVALVRAIESVELDYGVPSLDVVDGLLGRFHDSGDDPARMPETVFRFGAYIGEVIVRQARGIWVVVAEGHPMGGGWPLVELPGSLVNPVGKAFTRVEYGSPESIPYFYEVLVVRRHDLPARR